MKLNCLTGIVAVTLTLNAHAKRRTPAEDPYATLPRVAVPLQITGAALDDLDKIPTTFANRLLVGLGEATHGTREFNQIRFRLFRQLVLKFGYRLFLIEDEFSSSWAMNDYLLRGGDVVKVVQNSFGTPMTWGTDENLEMFEWMREFNAQHPTDPIVFYGVDMQRGFRGLPVLNELTRNFVNHRQIQTETEKLTQMVDQVDTTVQAILLEAKFDLDAYIELRRKVDAGVTKLDELLTQGAPPKELPKLRLLVTTIGQFFAKSNPLFLLRDGEKLGFSLPTPLKRARKGILKRAPAALLASDEMNFRDESMTNNTLALLRLEGENAKGVFWAHNGHVTFSETLTPISSSMKFLPIGVRLRQALGPRYLVVGTDFSEGTFSSGADPDPSVKAHRDAQSLERQLAALPAEAYWLDLRDPNIAPPLQAILKKKQPVRLFGVGWVPDGRPEHKRLVLPEVYDTLLFVRKSSVPTLKRMQNAK